MRFNPLRLLPRQKPSPTEQAELMRAEADKAFAELEIHRSRIRAKYLPMREESDRVLAPIGDPTNMHFIGSEQPNESLLDPISDAMGEREAQG